MLSNEQIKNLISEAIGVKKNSYAPYSSYKVGAAILANSGKIYTGCNFENASFGAGICAERVAIGNAISNGEQKFVALCVCGDKKDITPCGICRQSLSEFGDMDIICCNEYGENPIIYKLSELLPNAFKLTNL